MHKIQDTTTGGGYRYVPGNIEEYRPFRFWNTEFLLDPHFGGERRVREHGPHWDVNNCSTVLELGTKLHDVLTMDTRIVALGSDGILKPIQNQHL